MEATKPWGDAFIDGSNCFFSQLVVEIRVQLTEIDFVRIQPLLPGSNLPPISVSLVVSLPLN